MNILQRPFPGVVLVATRERPKIGCGLQSRRATPSSRTTMNEVGESVTVQIQHYIFSPLPFTFSVSYVQVHKCGGVPHYKGAYVSGHRTEVARGPT